MPLTEDDWHRRQIMAFIKAERLYLEIQRPVRVETEAGGVVDGTVLSLPTQLFRLTPFKRRLVNEWALSSQGEEVKVADWVLHGAYDADVEVGDFFVRDQYRYDVIWLNDHRRFRTAAGLKRRGEVRKV